MRHRIALTSFILIMGVALASCGDKKADPDAGGGAPPSGKDGGKSGDAKGGPGGGGMPPTEVGVVTLKSGPVEVTQDLPGRTSAYQVAEIRPQVSGIVLKRLFDEGSIVKAGQQLYQIDPATYQANYNTANANLIKTQAVLIAAKNLAARYKKLVAVNAISKQAYDDAIATLRADEADVAAAQAALENARIQLAYTRVLSPITGRIGKSTVTAGALVTASQADAIASVTQLDPMYVDVTQSSTQLLQLRQKMSAGQIHQDSGDAVVDLYLDDIKQRYPHPGRLKFSDVTVDPSTGSVDIRAEFPNPEGILLPGLFVRAVLRQGVRQNAILVPQQAVMRDGTGAATVWVIGDDNKAKKAPLKTGEALGANWLAMDGVKAGDRVVVQGTQKVQPSATVKAVEVDPNAKAPEKMDSAPGAGPGSGGGEGAKGAGDTSANKDKDESAKDQSAPPPQGGAADEKKDDKDGKDDKGDH